MQANEFYELCDSMGACKEGLVWIKGKSLREFWDTCPRADWMLWLLGKQFGKKGWPNRKKLVLLACLCAETALEFIPPGEDRPRKAIDTARAWCAGRATLAQVREAAAATYATATAAAYAAAATYATATAATYAAATAAAATATYAATATTYAATAAAYAAAATAAARSAHLKKMAEMIRAALPVPFHLQERL